MVCFYSISHAEQICRISPRPTLTRSLYRSINVHGRPWDSKLLPIDYERCCSDQLNPPSKADIDDRAALTASVADDPKPTKAPSKSRSAVDHSQWYLPAGSTGDAIETTRVHHAHRGRGSMAAGGARAAAWRAHAADWRAHEQGRRRCRGSRPSLCL